MSEPADKSAPASPVVPVELAEGPYDILKNRDFLFYLIARFIASFGQQMLATAVGWEIYDRTGSTMALGYVGLAQVVPMFLFTLPAGHTADTHDRKKIIIWTQVVMGVACAGLAAASFWKLSVGWYYLWLFVMGTSRTYLWPASASFMPQLVPRKQFAKAVTWNTGSFQVSAVAGPAAGGAVIALTTSAATVYGLNFIMIILCVALVWLVRTHHVAAERKDMNLNDMLAGLRFVFKTPVVLGTMSLDLFAVLLGGATAMLPVYCKDILHVGPSELGWLQAALPIGSAVMALIMVHRPPLQKAGHTLLWAVAIFGLATIGFGYSRWFWLSFATLFICGFVDYISVVVRHTLVQLLTPDEMRGRVSAINSLFIGTSNQMGEVESGFVAHWFGSVFAVVSGGVGTLIVVAATAVIWPEIRRYGRLDQ